MHAARCPSGPMLRPVPMSTKPEVSLWQFHSKFSQPKYILAVVFWHWQQNHTFKCHAPTFFWCSCFTPDVEPHRAGSHGLHRNLSTVTRLTSVAKKSDTATSGEPLIGVPIGTHTRLILYVRFTVWHHVQITTKIAKISGRIWTSTYFCKARRGLPRMVDGRRHRDQLRRTRQNVPGPKKEITIPVERVRQVKISNKFACQVFRLELRFPQKGLGSTDLNSEFASKVRGCIQIFWDSACSWVSAKDNGLC